MSSDAEAIWRPAAGLRILRLLPALVAAGPVDRIVHFLHDDGRDLGKQRRRHFFHGQDDVRQRSLSRITPSSGLWLDDALRLPIILIVFGEINLKLERKGQRRNRRVKPK